MNKKFFAVIVIIMIFICVVCTALAFLKVKSSNSNKKAEKYVSELEEDAGEALTVSAESEEESSTQGVFIYGLNIEEALPLSSADINSLPVVTVEELPEWVQQDIARGLEDYESVSWCYAFAKRYYGDNIMFEHSSKMASHVYDNCYNCIYGINGVVVDFVITTDGSHIYMFEYEKE